MSLVVMDAEAKLTATLPTIDTRSLTQLKSYNKSMTIDFSKIFTILNSEQGYTENQINLIIKDIDPLNKDLHDALSRWMEDRSVTNYELAGLTLEHLLQNDQRNFIPALGLLNNLLNNENINHEAFLKVIDNLKNSKNIEFEIDR